MSNARKLADLLDSTGDVKSTALDNVPASNNASALSTGTLPDGRFPATLPAASATNLTAIPAGNLTGTVADARISTLTSSKLTGALPAISGASLTNLPADATKLPLAGGTLTGALSVNSNITSTKASGENKLIVSATAVSQAAKVSLQTNATTPGQAILYMGKSDASTNGQVGYNPNDNSMYFYTNNTEKLKITSQGELQLKESSYQDGMSRFSFNSFVTLADDSSFTFSPADGVLVFISTNSSTTMYRSALFFTETWGGSPVKLADEGNWFSNADTDGKICCFKSGNSGNVTIKNRVGVSKNISVGTISNTGQ
jgi:hypothetical protein